MPRKRFPTRAYYDELVRQLRVLDMAQSVLDRDRSTLDPQEAKNLQDTIDRTRATVELEVINVRTRLSL